MARRTMKSEAKKSVIVGVQLVVLGTLFILILKTCVAIIDGPIVHTSDLTREQRAEVIRRLDCSPLEKQQQIDMADRILNKRVEGNWREKR